MFSLVGLLAVLFFVFIYLFPWIETDSGKAIGFACIGVLAESMTRALPPTILVSA